ncbi:DUF2777 family protein [Ferdinandcohnia quinoae]|uniref:DUF2777 domain-containing protein n=1 Tax=Fredinandcohnia quinoae TaxID=2918902 RepID=A0AAW5E3L8_9BACI|nr:DUF2777 family protein [Fredinandcohnia sp. SECRCQ15]MCH1625835.1 DUF2777 domain-containing protein [Fredinandcohnia sp. SECRCQ15]
MDLQQRLGNIKEQKRSHIVGTVECINEQWIFFDAESDEASMLEEMIDHDVEVFTLNRWEKGVFVEEGLIKMCDYFYKLENGDCLRFRKWLPQSYNKFLENFSEDLFLKYTSLLNNLSFSLYDCIHCHNQFIYSKDKQHFQGVNFIIYDNTETICSVHHHFSRNSKEIDRFEFTIATGKRAILTNLQKREKGVDT